MVRGVFRPSRRHHIHPVVADHGVTFCGQGDLVTLKSGHHVVFGGEQDDWVLCDPDLTGEQMLVCRGDETLVVLSQKARTHLFCLPGGSLDVYGFCPGRDRFWGFWSREVWNQAEMETQVSLDDPSWQDVTVRVAGSTLRFFNLRGGHDELAQNLLSSLSRAQRAVDIRTVLEPFTTEQMEAVLRGTSVRLSLGSRLLHWNWLFSDVPVRILRRHHTTSHFLTILNHLNALERLNAEVEKTGPAPLVLSGAMRVDTPVGRLASGVSGTVLAGSMPSV